MDELLEMFEESRHSEIKNAIRKVHIQTGMSESNISKLCMMNTKFGGLEIQNVSGLPENGPDPIEFLRNMFRFDVTMKNHKKNE